MSKGARVEAAERTAIMLDLLRRSIEGEYNEFRLRSHVMIEEVAPSTGWGANRYADVLELGVWPSTGMELHGYEIKATRSDLKRELADPSKHKAVARYCDKWTLIAWDESVIKDLDIPPTWGITLTKSDGDNRSLEVLRKAPKMVPEAWTRNFVCSLVRNASEQSIGAAYLARAILATHKRAQSEYRHTLDDAAHALTSPLARALYGDNYYRHSREPDEVIKDAVARLTQPMLAKEGT